MYDFSKIKGQKVNTQELHFCILATNRWKLNLKKPMTKVEKNEKLMYKPNETWARSTC